MTTEGGGIMKTQSHKYIHVGLHAYIKMLHLTICSNASVHTSSPPHRSAGFSLIIPLMSSSSMSEMMTSANVSGLT